MGSDLVVAEHHAAHETLVLLSGVGDPPAASFGHHVARMKDPEKAVLKVLRTVHSTAFKLQRERETLFLPILQSVPSCVIDCESILSHNTVNIASNTTETQTEAPKPKHMVTVTSW